MDVSKSIRQSLSSLDVISRSRTRSSLAKVIAPAVSLAGRVRRFNLIVCVEKERISLAFIGSRCLLTRSCSPIASNWPTSSVKPAAMMAHPLMRHPRAELRIAPLLETMLPPTARKLPMDPHQLTQRYEAHSKVSCHITTITNFNYCIEYYCFNVQAVF